MNSTLSPNKNKKSRNKTSSHHPCSRSYIKTTSFKMKGSAEHSELLLIKAKDTVSLSDFGFLNLSEFVFPYPVTKPHFPVLNEYYCHINCVVVFNNLYTL